MDPQQRLMMEVAYEAFENAGVTPQTLSGDDTSCWMGVNSSSWRETLFRDAEAAPLHTWTGTGPEYISGRVSWFFNLRWAGMMVNTAVFVEPCRAAWGAQCDSGGGLRDAPI